VTAPRVSVVMPVYNAEAYLAEAVESVLAQTFKDFELLAVDDASTDRSPELLAFYARKDPRVRVLRNPQNLMISRTLNAGLNQAQGEYLARMDADDVSLPDRLAKQVAYLDAHPRAGVVGGTMVITDATGRATGERRYHLTDAAIRRHLFRYNPFSHPLVMMRTAIVRAVGGYLPEYDFAEDYELYFRIGRKAEFGNLPDVLLRYRVVPRSLTAAVTRAMELQTLAVRRRAAKEYGYAMTGFDKIYWLLQYLSVYCIPPRWKSRLFSMLRQRLVRVGR
jgi:glycosyltransferase involved in cell wall biosynthesis